jgi:RNA polymerase sigma factor (TIGR02999 family)
LSTRIRKLLKSVSSEFSNPLKPLNTDTNFVELLDELRAMARAARARMASGQTLVTTALVNEVYLKMRRERSAQVQDQQHFFALAARAMREILIDDARRRQTRLANTEDALDLVDTDPTQLLAVDQLLQELSAINPRMVEVVNCRFFAGYTEEETAQILKVDVRTIQRDWQRARAFMATRS